MSFPKVLIFGQPFSSNSGGGITLSNLFKGWDRKKIAVAATGNLLVDVSFDICNIYYQLGNREFMWKFPFNLLQKKFPSGLKSFNPKSEFTVSHFESRIRKVLVDDVFYPFIEWIGAFHWLSKICLTDNLKSWLDEFKPEVLYFQVSSRQTVLFALDLCNYLKVPAIIHMMDDWPATISKKGLFSKYWNKKIDYELRLLLDKVQMHLSISEEMSQEYMKRYKKHFKAFHNPIDLGMWQPHSKTDFSFTGDHIKILYSGRIGPGITKSLIEVADAISRLDRDGVKINLYIQSAFTDPKIMSRLQRYNCVVFNPRVEYSDLPNIFSHADILLIANDFDDTGKAFLKFSIPTKASEYMISGTPILVYAPSEAAISKFCEKNKCALCVTTQNVDAIAQSIEYLINNESIRKRLSNSAVRVAKLLFDADNVRFRFRSLLVQLPQNN